MEELSRLTEVACPEDVALGSARTRVDEHCVGQVPAEVVGIPEASRGHGDDPRRRFDREILRRSCHPIEERPPDAFRLLPFETLEHHEHVERVARPERRLLAPMRVEERVVVDYNDALL